MPRVGLRPPLLFLLSALLGTGLVVAPIPPTSTVAAAASYTRPTGLRAASVANNAIALTWTRVKGAPAYRVQFSRYSDMRSAKTMDLVDNYLEWTHLDPEPSKGSGRLRAGTNYYFRVKVISAVDLAHTAANLTSYSSKIRIRTSNSSSRRHLAPVRLSSTARSATSMYVSWASRGPGVAYRVRYGTTPTLTGGDTRTTVMPYSGGVLDKLRAGTTYYWRVTTVTANGSTTLSPASAIRSMTTPASSGSPAVVVANYNICSYACSDWSGRKAIIVTSLVRQAPDVLTLQEATRGADLVEAYNDASGRNFLVAVDTSHSDLAYDAERFTVEDRGEHTFSVDGAKNAVWAILGDRRNGGRRVFVVSTHLTNSDSSAAQRARPIEAREVLAMISENNPNDLPVIIGGDFNVSKRKADHPAVYGVMLGAGMVDPLGNPSDSRYVSRAATAEHRLDVGYASANQFRRRALRSKWLNGYDVDYLWTSKNVRTAMFQVVVDLDTNGNFIGTMPSDHNMLVGRFHLS